MKLTPHPILLSLSGRLLQVTVAISPSAAKGASKGTFFCAHPIGRSPQANAGFRKVGERGASAAKQEFIPSVRYGWISGRGLAVRFGPASWSSLVIEFCQQSGFYRLPKKFLQRCVFLPAGEGFSFVGEVPFSLRSLNAAFVGGPSGLS